MNDKTPKPREIKKLKVLPEEFFNGELLEPMSDQKKFQHLVLDLINDTRIKVNEIIEGNLELLSPPQPKL